MTTDVGSWRFGQDVLSRSVLAHAEQTAGALSRMPYGRGERRTGILCASADLVGLDREVGSPYKGGPMLYYALVFLVFGLVASLLGAYGVAAVASQIAWVLFVIGIVLIVLHLISGRRTIVP